jgi:3-carboxy-cis,cis-muconate cycloisomerase
LTVTTKDLTHRLEFDSDFNAPHVVFGDEARLQRMLDFESALARAEARCGLFSQATADTISSVCRDELFDRTALAHDAERAGNLAIPLVKQLTRLVEDKDPMSSRYVHWGATSQDAIDTGMVLQLRDALASIGEDLRALCGLLADLTERYRDTLMPGRTWLQHAVPITFGLKLAGWLDACLRHRERLSELKPRVLTLQFGGAAGTLAFLGNDGDAVTAALAAEMQLSMPDIAWHTCRDRIAETGAWCGLLTGSLGKMARDLSLTSQTEVGETAEAAGGGSSTMPQKRNPVAAAAVLSVAIRVPGLVSTLLSAMVQEHERGLGGWQAEWATLPEICVLTGGALHKMIAALHDLEVYPDAMLRNLDASSGLIMAEAVSAALAARIGRSEAHSLVEAASRRAAVEGKHLRIILEDTPAAMQHLTHDQLDEILTPSNYLGSAQQMIDRVLDKYRELE